VGFGRLLVVVAVVGRMTDKYWQRQHHLWLVTGLVWSIDVVPTNGGRYGHRRAASRIESAAETQERRFRVHNDHQIARPGLVSFDNVMDEL
jgi:hypothetical protein